MTVATRKNIPEELRSYSQWICHDTDKRPINPHTGRFADVSDPTTWGTFDQACAAHDAGRGVGIGFVFTENDPLTGIDLDVPECGTATPLQEQVFAAFPSYAERSPSGRGVHIIVKGRVPAAIKDSAQGIEAYSTRRYFTFTGDVVRKERPLEMQEALDALYARLRPPDPASFYTHETPDDVSLVCDAEAVAFVRKSEANRRNWDGEGVADQSKAFGAVVGALALVGCSREQAKRLALSSPLVVNGPPHSSGTRPEKSARDFDRIWPALARRGAVERQERALGVDHGRQVAQTLLTGWNERGGAAQRPRFRVQHVSDIEAREPDFIVGDLIEARSCVVVFGAPGSGKSFVTLDVAACVASGREFHGKEVQQGCAVYVAGEGGAGIKRRLQAWSKHTGEELDKSKPLFVIQSPIEMLNASDVKAACDAIAEATGEFTIKIIVLDTLARNFGDGDENSTGDMNRFVMAVGRMIERFGCTVVVVHHSGHGDNSRGRGSSALRAAADAEFRVEKDNSTVTLVHTKAKDAPESEPIRFSLESIELGTRKNGAPFTSAVLIEREEQVTRAIKLTRSQQRAMKAFEDAAKEHGQFADDGSFVGVHRDDWRTAFYRIATQDNDDSKSKAFRRACTDLVEKGELDVADDVFRYVGSFAWVKNQAVTATRTAGQDTDITGHVQMARP
ncbi:AAA family ATPase [Thalassobius sp. Cn5-15]|uniref:AAA family ATPase n=1 Tax=Thalassobius sp. Cn5-15 TaxID=2917763 RepID=UPI001EF17F5E|nr:AAA family ATPase [Thalassobius sp. Cn5-15]MCG7493291.1 AAA family ATPase [Thalassobius sp. Cn5-15]